MLLEQTIRRHQSKGYPRGYSVPLLSTTTDPGFLETVHKRGREESAEGFFKETSLPQAITLRVKLKPIPFTSPTLVQAYVNHNAYSAGELYKIETAASASHDLALHSRYEAIEVIFTGLGTYKNPSGKVSRLESLEGSGWHLEVLKNERIYRKPFIFQSVGNLTQRRRAMGEGNWFFTPPFHESGHFNIHPLFGYGGYYKLGATLEKMEQVYGQVGSFDNRTVVDLSPAHTWQERGIVPQENSSKAGEWGRYNVFFCDPFQQEAMVSLKGALESGYAKIILTSMEKNKAGSKREYFSHATHQIDETGSIFDITFSLKQ